MVWILVFTKALILAKLFLRMIQQGTVVSFVVQRKRFASWPVDANLAYFFRSLWIAEPQIQAVSLFAIDSASNDFLSHPLSIVVGQNCNQFGEIIDALWSKRRISADILHVALANLQIPKVLD